MKDDDEDEDDVKDDDEDEDDLTVEIGEDINSVEDLVRFPPPVVFCLRMIEIRQYGNYIGGG